MHHIAFGRMQEALLLPFVITTAFGALLFLMGYASSGIGFMVGWSADFFGLSKFQIVDCFLSANHLCFPLGSQP